MPRTLSPRHHLGPPDRLAASPLVASSDLVGFHGTDPTSVYLAAWARVRDFGTADLERALYEDRSLLKILGMRRTMFVVSREVAAIIQAACTDSIASGERERLFRMIREAGIAEDPERWLAGVEEQTLEALHRLGEATAADLAREVPGLRAQIPFGEGRRWQGTVGVSTRLLFLLSAEGRIVRGRPKGTLVSSLYRWVPMDRWVPGGLLTMPKADAQAELVRRYLAAFGPATLIDVKWWTGWTVAESKRALTAIGAREIRLDDGGSGWALPGEESGTEADDTAHPAPDPWVALLGPLDATPMGWQERNWFLGPHKARMFDRAGNVGPSIWLNDRIVGGWAQRRDGEIRWELLEDLGSDVTRLVEAKVAALREWLGPLRFIPRFRTPIEQDLSA
jgi:hypothetical protein